MESEYKSTNMRTYVKMTRRRTKCFYCEKMIEAGEYQIVCVYFMKPKHSSRTWTKAMHFHAQPVNCWLERAVIELQSRPHLETRGRKANVLSDEKKVMRLKILRRRASVIQRLEQEMTSRVRPVKIAHLAECLEKLAVEIEQFGGVPKLWK